MNRFAILFLLITTNYANAEGQLFGEAEWSIRGHDNDPGFQLSLETDGQGLGSRLPPPLSKETDQVGDIQVSLTSSPELKSFNARLFDATEIRGDLGTNPLVLEIITPEVGIIDWATVPARDGDGPNSFSYTHRTLPTKA